MFFPQTLLTGILLFGSLQAFQANAQTENPLPWNETQNPTEWENSLQSARLRKKLLAEMIKGVRGYRFRTYEVRFDQELRQSQVKKLDEGRRFVSDEVSFLKEASGLKLFYLKPLNEIKVRVEHENLIGITVNLQSSWTNHSSHLTLKDQVQLRLWINRSTHQLSAFQSTSRIPFRNPEEEPGPANGYRDLILQFQPLFD